MAVGPVESQICDFRQNMRNTLERNEIGKNAEKEKVSTWELGLKSQLPSPNFHLERGITFIFHFKKEEKLGPVTLFDHLGGG